jgi:hypothetical protein
MGCAPDNQLRNGLSRQAALFKTERGTYMPGMSTLRATAYHEAGHAVASVFLDVDFEKVDIIGHEQAAGHIIYADPEPEIQAALESGDRDDPRVKQWVEHSLIVTLAGAIAHSDWRFGSTGDAEFPGVGKIPELGSDLSNVMRRINDLGYTGKVAETYQRDLAARAEALVKEYWPMIQKVAEALLEYKILFADDVHQLVFGSFDDGLDD